jgi:hypothetical protein
LQKHPSDDYFYRRFIKRDPLYINILSDIQIDEIKRAKLVILYGAGYIASIVSEVLDYRSIVDYMIAVTVPDDNEKNFRGRKGNSITKFCGVKESLVIVAMSKKNEGDINKISDDNKLDNVMWVTLN